MNESLSITHLEAERQRRQIDQLARLARSGAELPMPEIRLGGRTSNTYISFGAVKIELEWTSLDGAPKTPDLYMSNEEVEEKLFAVFHDETVTKKYYDHIFKALEVRMGKSNGTVTRYGDTKFCG